MELPLLDWIGRRTVDGGRRTRWNAKVPRSVASVYIEHSRQFPDSPYCFDALSTGGDGDSTDPDEIVNVVWTTKNVVI